jgi:uncharacterized protein
MVYEEPRAPRLYGDDDLPWISRLLEIAERAVGEPWRVLVERVDAAPLGVHPSHRAALLAALRRVLGGGAQRARIARAVRALVLGAPALDPSERAQRLADAAATLGTTPEDVEALLWTDLATERPVALSPAQPTAVELAAVANLDKLQRWVRRAHDVKLQVWDGANDLVRAAARHGLIAHVVRDGDATVLDVLGPLALFHSTMVYGRALAALVPLLADHTRFALEIRCELGGARTELRIAPPVRLPAVRAAPRRAPSIAERLARELIELGHRVEREPPAIASGDHLVFPDLAVDRGGQRWFVEVIGFATRDYLETKLARYRAAGVTEVILCVDLASAPDCDLLADVCSFTRRIDADDLLAAIGSRSARGRLGTPDQER